MSSQPAASRQLRAASPAIELHCVAMLTDDELVQGFEAGSLTAFPHAQHVRLTIIYLARHGRDETLRRMCDGLLRFATVKGDPEKFHVTVTRAWIKLIESARRAHPGIHDPGALVAACPQLLDQNALLRFYSPERLNSGEARLRWLPPDLLSPIGIHLQTNSPADPTV
jgi:hypothetical protein